MKTIEQKAQDVEKARRRYKEARDAFREVNRRYPGGLRPGATNVPLDAAERREWETARDAKEAANRAYDEAITELRAAQLAAEQDRAAAYLHSEEAASC